MFFLTKYWSRVPWMWLAVALGPCRTTLLILWSSPISSPLSWTVWRITMTPSANRPLRFWVIWHSIVILLLPAKPFSLLVSAWRILTLSIHSFTHSLTHSRCRYPSVCNNAIWSLGELVVRLGTNIGPYVEMIMPLLIAIATQPRISAGIRDNSTITICRICMVIPEVAAPYIQAIYGMLCLRSSNINEEKEKEDATRGLCNVLQVNSNLLNTETFPAFANLAASW